MNIKKSSSSQKVPRNYSKKRRQWHIVPLELSATRSRKRGTEMQDASAYLLRKDYLILTVADGHGSAIFSAIGASLAVESFIQVAREMLVQNASKSREYADKEILRPVKEQLEVLRNPGMFGISVVGRWRSLVEKRYQDITNAFGISTTIHDNNLHKLFGSTLLGSITVFGQYTVFFQIGDGAIYFSDTNNHELQRVFAAQSNDTGIETGEVWSLASKQAHIHSQIKVHSEPPLGFMLVTDGFTKAFPNETSRLDALSKFYDYTLPRKQRPLNIPFLCWWLNDIARNSGDDSSLLIAHHYS